MDDPLDAPATRRDLMLHERKMAQMFSHYLEQSNQELLREVKNHIHVLADNARRSVEE